MNHEIEQDGFTVVPELLGAPERQKLIDSLGPVAGAGRRGLLATPMVAALAHSDRFLDLIRPHLPSEAVPVRAIYFDKTPATNWGVPWHQDLTLAVRERADVPGFGPWSIKDDVVHVQPPVDLLQRMLTVRLHLDDTDASNGALQILAGSHCLGRLSAGRIRELRAQHTAVTCAVPAGGALLMRPLLLHASQRSTSPRHRRVLHIEYAAYALPPGLEWHEASDFLPSHSCHIRSLKWP